MRANAIKHTKDVLIKYLRSYLANPDNYSYFCEGRDFSGTAIWDKDPNDLRQLPAVVITGGTGQLITGGLSDFAEEVRDPATGELISHRYGGIYEFSISIDIGTKTTKERELLTDLVSLAYRVHLRRFMEREGVIVKDMRYGGEVEEQSDSDKIYVSTIQLTTWSEWVQDVDLITLDDLNINT